MSTIYSKDQTLPDFVGEILRSDSLTLSERNTYARALNRNGWTLAAIAKASGISRERVRQVVELPPVSHSHILPMPIPPMRPAPKPAKVYPAPDPAKLARLIDIQPLARKVVGNSPKYREYGEEYTRIINDIHKNDKIPLYRLAKYLGVTAGALRSRLVRYGEIEPGSFKSKSYNRINPENRVS